MYEQLNLLTRPPTSERQKGPDPALAPAAPPRSGPARWTAPYGAVRGGRYFRFYWQETAKTAGGETVSITRHLHIRGGSTTNPAAIANRQAVDELIAAGASVETICRVIRSQARSVGNHKKEVAEN